MKNRSLILAVAGLSLLSFLVSCSPSSRLSWVKAHPGKEAVTVSTPKSKPVIMPIEQKHVAANYNQASTHTIIAPVKPVALISPSSNRVVLHTNKSVKHNAMVHHIISRVSHTTVAHHTTLGVASGADPELRKAIGLMIIGLIIAVFEFLPIIGWLFGIVGLVVFLIGLYYLIMYLL